MLANIKFDQSYQQTPKRQGVAQLASQNNASNLKIKELLDDDAPFTGLYLRVEGKKSLDSDYFDKRVGIDFEIFENGYYESYRENLKKRQESQLENLQQQNNIQLKALDATFHRLNLMKNLVNRKLQRKQTALLYALKENNKRQLEQALITKSQFSEIELALKQSILLEQYTQKAAIEKIPEDWLIWLNNIENLELKASSKLIEMALERSVDAKIQDLMIARSDNHPGYLDNLKVKVFYEQRDDSRLNVDKESVIGLQARIPIDFNTSRDELVTLKKNSYRLQKRVITERLMQKVDSLKNQFFYHQSKLQHLLNQHQALEVQRLEAVQQLQVDLTGLRYTPENTLNRLALEKVKSQQAILLARLDNLALLKHIQSTVGSSQLDQLLQ
ncbi:hypothetical protein [Pseudoalteromonas sp. G4]|uniref:hypothetical protein n=1 Tax=Pseudoalteromonas sp. G4 TaxID=2992761 RepID=UPI00237E898F|nr:hypothetical protein [Pseudoalteromonas sp. G4]MDE3273348.1 hypothetical protein [Pseudoalteromonas sp. G4]